MAKKKAFDAKTGTDFLLDPFEDLCVIGLDTKHKPGEHLFYDERCQIPLNPRHVENVVRDGVTDVVKYSRVDCSADPRFGDWCSAGKIAFVVDGRQRTRWARAASVIRAERGIDPQLVRVWAKEAVGTELQLLIRSRSANAVRVISSPIVIANEILMLRGVGQTDEDIGITLALDPREIEDYLKLRELSPKAQGLINEGRLKRTAANLLLEMTHVEMDAQLDKLIEEGLKLTVETVRARRGPSAAGKKETERRRNVSVKQIGKMSTILKDGEIDMDPAAAKAIHVLAGNLRMAGSVRGMKKLLAAVGYELEAQGDDA